MSNSYKKIAVIRGAGLGINARECRMDGSCLDGAALHGRDIAKARDKLGWQPVVDFRHGLSETIRYFANSEDWKSQA